MTTYETFLRTYTKQIKETKKNGSSHYVVVATDSQYAALMVKIMMGLETILPSRDQQK